MTIAPLVRRLRRHVALAWLAPFLALAGARHAGAAGFSLVDQTGRGLGNAYAGEAAAAVDASTIAFNPAGLVRLEGTQTVTSASFVALGVSFHDRGSSLDGEGGTPLRGERNVDSEPVGVAPAFWLAHRLSPRWAVGLGFMAPFGFRTYWGTGWVGRYHASESDLKTLELSPSIAVRLTDRLALGVEANVQYAHATLTSALDLGTICAQNSAAVGVPASVCTALGLRPQAVDGFARIGGSSWGAGASAGLLWEPRPDLRIGLSYRSTVRHEFSGDATFALPARAAILRSTGALRPTTARFTMDLPDVVRLAAYQDVTSRLALMAGVAWTHWARFDAVVFRFDNRAQPAVVQREGWTDSWRYSLGLAYRATPRWTLQVGTAYDEGAVPNAALRTPRIPDTDRVWLSTGIGWHATERLSVDLSYAHLFGLDSETRNRDPVTGHVLRGTFRGSAELLGLQASWRWR